MCLQLFDRAREAKVEWAKPRPRGQPREPERGQTIFLLAVALVVVLGMAALAVDVTFFYIAHSQAQKAADAAALAGAKAFVSSGFTSGQLGDPASGGAQALVCNGSSGLADALARAATTHNKIAGAVPANVTTTCNFAAGNPQITVTLGRTDLPIFFGRIWARGGMQVSARAKAEAYNPSGETVPIAVGSVKPWLITNCDLPPTNCHFLDPTRNYAIVNTPPLIGTTIRLQQFQLNAGVPIGLLPGVLSTFYPLNMPITPTPASCPSPASALSCGSIDPGAPGYFETAACANSTRLQCGPAAPQGVSAYALVAPTNTDQAALCLAHADDLGLNRGQDAFNSLGPGFPQTIEGGFNNPNPALRGVLNISRSDSVVTVPLWDGNVDPLHCLLTTCPDNIVGFVQLGITQVTKPTLGPISVVVVEAVVLNISGCGAATGGGAPVAGGGISPVPVRLVR